MTDQFAIKHAGTIVLPARGKWKRRAPFESIEAAAEWATKNYREGTLWEVVPYPPKAPRTTISRPATRLAARQKNRQRFEDIDARATALFDELNPNWPTETRVSKDECIKRVTRAAPGEARDGGSDG